MPCKLTSTPAMLHKSCQHTLVRFHFVSSHALHRHTLQGFVCHHRPPHTINVLAYTGVPPSPMCTPPPISSVISPTCPAHH